jgi:MFS family permease
MDSIKLAKEIKGAADGLSFMILFTFIWTIIAVAALDKWSFRLTGIIFIVLIISFIINYLKFNKTIKLSGIKLPEEENPEDKKQAKWFIIIFITEGVLILVTLNILVNLNMAQYFMPCFALIVGLHFYPLARLFKRTIHYYVAAWIILISIIGIVLTQNQSMPQNLIAAFIGFGCASGTSMLGMYMIYYGRKHSKALIELNK